MKITLLVIGKTTESYLNEAIQKYQARLKHYISFEIETIAGLKNTKNLSENQQKQKEAELLEKALKNKDHIILLDENGKEMTSLDFSNVIEKSGHTGAKNICFIVGGPYGFEKRIHDLANRKISLSRMTFSHQMIRLIFIEQLYRAFTILNNEPYHHQ